jgi:hypothetical protein
MPASRAQRGREAEKQRNGESESLRDTGVRVSDDTDDTDELPPPEACVRTLQEAAQKALADKSHGDPVFRFARAVKAFEVTNNQRLPDLELRSAFAIWWSLAKAGLPPETDREECLFLFMEAYEKAKTPLGANVIEIALQRVDTEPPPPETSLYESPKLKRLVHLCHELQLLNGNNPFFLSVRDAARAIACNRFETATALLNGLARAGTITTIERGKPGGHRASRFRFNFSRPAETNANAHE